MANSKELVVFKRLVVPMLAPTGTALVMGAQRIHDGPLPQDRFPDGWKVVTTDLDPHRGVHVVWDAHNPFPMQEKFDLVLVCSVLEHTQRPWVVAENVQRVLKPGGLIYVSVPWIWPYHGYPHDYWRLSDSSLRVIFPDIEWIHQIMHTMSGYVTDPREFGDRGNVQVSITSKTHKRIVREKGLLRKTQFLMVGRMKEAN